MLLRLKLLAVQVLSGERLEKELCLVETRVVSNPDSVSGEARRNVMLWRLKLLAVQVLSGERLEKELCLVETRVASNPDPIRGRLEGTSCYGD